MAGVAVRRIVSERVVRAGIAPGSASTLENHLAVPQWMLIAMWVVGAFVFLGFCSSVGLALCEYPAIYDGARLIGAHLYDPELNRQEQIHAIGGYSAPLAYVRLPYYAALIWPLGRLPYASSLVIWELGSLLALVVFVYLWPTTSKPFTSAVCAWSLPIALTLLYAEDDLWLLLLLAAIVRWGESHPEKTGLAASLLSMKFHLFLLLPLLLVGQSQWRFLRSLLIGGAVLAGLSFWVGGIAWPVEYWQAISNKAIMPAEYAMPNVRGLVSLVTAQAWPEALIDGGIAFLVWRVVRGSTFALGLAATLVGSLLVSHHAGVEDCVVLIPALLILGACKPAIALYCCALLSPVLYVLFSFKGACSAAGVFIVASILPLLYMSSKAQSRPI